MRKRHPQEWKSQRGESRPQQTSKQTQNQGFGEVLCEHAEPACSKRLPNGSFASMGSGPYQKEVRDVGAGDTQDQDDATQKCEDGRS